MKPSLILSLALLIQGCSTTPSEKPLKFDRFNLSATHCTFEHEKVNNHRLTEKMILLFPSLPGVIYGSPTDEMIEYVATEPQKDFVLELPQNMGDKAKTLLHKELTITPADTKIIRLGTFHIYPQTKKKIGGGMFIDSNSKQPYVLAYFSQPATLTGTLSSSNSVSTIDIKNAKAGWNWLKSVKKSDNEYYMTLHNDPATEIQFCALLRNTFST